MQITLVKYNAVRPANSSCGTFASFHLVAQSRSEFSDGGARSK